MVTVIFLVSLGCSTPQKTAIPSGKNSENKLSASEILPCNDCEIDFKAHGNDPEWSLTMDFESNFVFVDQSGMRIVAPSVAGIKAQDTNVTNYSVTADKQLINITLYAEGSTDKYSGQKYSYKVKVLIKNKSDKESKEYEGLGDYQVNLRLHNIWAFQKVNGKELIPSAYAKGIPVIELFVAEKRISGHDGCNQINGSFNTSGNTISFGTILSTLMACPKENLDFGTLLNNKTYQFRFGHNRLILTQNGKEIMELKNVD